MSAPHRGEPERAPTPPALALNPTVSQNPWADVLNIVSEYSATHPGGPKPDTHEVGGSATGPNKPKPGTLKLGTLTKNALGSGSTMPGANANPAGLTIKEPSEEDPEMPGKMLSKMFDEMFREDFGLNDPDLAAPVINESTKETTKVFDEFFYEMFGEEFGLKNIEPAASIIDESNEATAERFGDVFDQKHGEMFNEPINTPAALSE